MNQTNPGHRKHLDVAIEKSRNLLKRRLIFHVGIGCLLLAILISAVLSVSIGQVKIPFGTSLRILFQEMTGRHISSAGEKMFADVIWQIRFPRVLLAMAVGAGLSLCGTVMQASVQNLLADPYIMGISSGAALGATFSIMLGFRISGLLGTLSVSTWAFVGALMAAALVLGLSSIGGKASAVKLILAGTIINALCSALSNFMIYFAPNAEGIRSVSFWTMGSLTSAQWSVLPVVSIVVLGAILFFLFQFRVMNTMLMGEETAMTLGIHLNGYRRLYLTVSSVITGILVSTCGIIGFVGLIIPHIVRSVVGSDHRRLTPAAILFGAFFMIWADVFARRIIHNGELPIGIVTSILGAPVFMYMLIKRNYGFGGK